MAAAGSLIPFAKNIPDFRMRDLVGATVKLALLTSAATPDTSVTGHSIWADLSASEIAALGGYNAGGKALTSMAIAAISNGWKFSSADVAWLATGVDIAAHRYGVLVVSGTLWSMVNPLVGVFVVDATPADKPPTTVGNTLAHYCPAAGWFDSSKS